MYGHTTDRIMELHHLFAVSPHGLTKEEIFVAIPSYKAKNEYARSKMLFRDIGFLRKRGLEIIWDRSAGAQRYRIMEVR